MKPYMFKLVSGEELVTMVVSGDFDMKHPSGTITIMYPARVSVIPSDTGSGVTVSLSDWGVVGDFTKPFVLMTSAISGICHLGPFERDQYIKYAEDSVRPHEENPPYELDENGNKVGESPEVSQDGNVYSFDFGKNTKH